MKLKVYWSTIQSVHCCSWQGIQYIFVKVALLGFLVKNGKDTIIASLSASIRLAPGDVRPGHIMFAPLKINLMAPLSTCWCGNMNGS